MSNLHPHEPESGDKVTAGQAQQSTLRVPDSTSTKLSGTVNEIAPIARATQSIPLRDSRLVNRDGHERGLPATQNSTLSSTDMLRKNDLEHMIQQVCDLRSIPKAWLMHSSSLCNHSL